MVVDEGIRDAMLINGAETADGTIYHVSEF